MPLLNASEEVELVRCIENGRMARVELAGGNVSPHRRIELRKLIEDGWSRASAPDHRQFPAGGQHRQEIHGARRTFP